MVNEVSLIEETTFVAASREMLHVRELARRAGRTDAKVLITGESGVGKDVVAREIHSSSLRARTTVRGRQLRRNT